METCVRCGISGEKARLFDAIYEGKTAMLCERCTIIENIPIIKKPDASHLKSSEKNIDVYERMKRLSGYKEHKDEEKLVREQRLRELDKNPKLELPVKEQLNLVEHFHWDIMKNRRRKGLSHKQLAEAIGESEIAVDMLEKGKLPENSEILIKKLEQFFQINLRKISEAEAMVIRKQKMVRTKPILLDEYGNELINIPEPEVEQEIPIYLETHEVKEVKEIPWYKKILGRRKKEEEISEEIKNSKFAEENIPEEIYKEEPVSRSRYLEYRRKELMAKNPEKFKEKHVAIELKENEDLELERVDISRVRIGDLKNIHKKRVEATKQERRDEQKKIANEKNFQTEENKYLNSFHLEEKQRLIETRKEEFRARKEKESKNIDDSLGGKELFER